MSEIRSRASIVADLVERDYVHMFVEVRDEIYGIENKLENLKIFFRRNKRKMKIEILATISTL